MWWSPRAEVIGERSRTALEARYVSKQDHPSSALFAELGRSAGFNSCGNNRGLRWSVSGVELLSKPVIFRSKTTFRVPCSLSLVEVQGSLIMIMSLRAEEGCERSRTALEARYISKQEHTSCTLFAQFGLSAGFDIYYNARGLTWSVCGVELLSKPVIFRSQITLRVPCSLSLVEVQGSAY